MNRLPPWFKQLIPDSKTRKLSRYLSSLGVVTVCKQSKCPNIAGCFSAGRLTFMILGDTCTRNCLFCNVKKSGTVLTVKIDEDEPAKIAEVISKLGLKYAVITSVTRDDLADGGAGHFVRSIEQARKINKGIKVEVLIPDFCGKIKSLKMVVAASPDILAHNIEMVKRLYPSLRPKADYDRSLSILKNAKELSPGIKTKSSIMLGLGEKEEEVIDCMKELRACSCDILTLGQYLAPSKEHYPVQEFVSLEQFQVYKKAALELGFKGVSSGPLVRSSYLAEQVYEEFIHA